MPTSPRRDKPTSIRLSAQDRRRLVALAKKLEVTQAAVIKLALKAMAEKEGVET